MRAMTPATVIPPSHPACTVTLPELNKLSDLRGSFHHLAVEIRDPEWRQEEEPHKLIKVEPEEVRVYMRICI